LLKYNNVNSLIKEANIKRDEKNNIIALSIPNISTKNETKISCLKNYHENSLMKTERNNAKKLHENSDFVASISLIKKLNNLMDNQLEEAIEETVSRWPNLIYLTKNELSNIIETSLESAGITSFDDKLCDEISESLLKSAHLAYTEKTEAIINSSGKSIKNTYEEFSELTKDYFPHLDESAALEMQSYVDLYEALKHVYSISLNEGMKKSTYAVLSDLSAVIEQKIDPDYEILENAVELLNNYIETNLNPQDWVVSNDVHVSLTGENPVLAQKAKQSYSPANDLEGDGYKDTAPVGDGETYSGDLAKTMRNNSWGNHKNDAWPNLSNPYVPKPFGSYKIKDETAIEDDKSLVDQGGNDVWPNLNNPYVK
jgi:hypothetical protein